MNRSKSVSLLFQKKDFEKVSFFIVARYNRELNFFKVSKCYHSIKSLHFIIRTQSLNQYPILCQKQTHIEMIHIQHLHKCFLTPNKFS